MEAVFLRIFNMSITAGWAAIAVIILRLLLFKAPKKLHAALWGLVALRLMLPFSKQSIFSIIPSADTLPGNIMMSKAPAINSGISFIDNAINNAVLSSLYPSEYASVNPMQIVIGLASLIWLVGVAAMLIYTAASYIKTRYTVREFLTAEDGVRLCDRVEMPFIFGVFRPRIYLPSHIDECNYSYVIAHERAHLKRLDHVWKLLGFALLCVYWFNPLLWLAYTLFCRDIELACDEKVLRDSGSNIKKAYSAALLNCNTSKKHIGACPIAFGETSVKARVKNVLRYKKPSRITIAISIVLCVIVSFCVLTDPSPYATVFSSLF